MKSYLIVILQFGTFCLIAQTNRFDQYITPMYDLDLLKASRVLIENPDKIPPQKLELLSIHLNWWKLNSGYKEHEGYTDSTLEQITKYVNQLEQLNEVDKSTSISLNILEALLIKSRVDLMDENYFDGVVGMVKCLKYIEELKENNNDLDEFKLIDGLYNYYYDFAYQNYFLLRPFLLAYPEGSMEKGLIDLKALARTSESAVKAEANFFLGKIYLESEENSAEALKYTSVVVTLHPNNFVYALLHARALKASHNDTELFQHCLKEQQKLESCGTLDQYSLDYFSLQFKKHD
ncbi:MAG: hypothetical protein OSB25_04365 [Salibacteraceae bacterium]|nr:hypothetical protein [Salibacteraceae bacterium]